MLPDMVAKCASRERKAAGGAKPNRFSDPTNQMVFAMLWLSLDDSPLPARRG
jgi:hypothetical protein